MIIKAPTPEDIPALWQLWKEAFGDADSFLNKFFSAGFSPDRCRCLTADGQLAAALYWFDCTLKGKKVAYLYAVATAKQMRGKGLCRALVEDTHKHLKALGYAGAALVPGNEGLFSLYARFGYKSFCPMTAYTVSPGERSLSLSPIGWQEYEIMRKPLLPESALLQDGKTLEFLSTFAQFYQGQSCLLCGYEEGGTFHICEYFGNENILPQIAATLGAAVNVRLPGGKNTAMYHSLEHTPDLPAYLGLTLN